MSDTNTNKTEEAIEEFSQRELGEVKILMIEDDEFFSEMVLLKLSHHGCIPYSTPNGNEAVALAGQYQPDIIILDLMLPGTSGELILKYLKADDLLKHIPVIVFSNKSDEADIRANLEAGATEYLVKSSTDLNTLVEVVKKVASQKDR